MWLGVFFPQCVLVLNVPKSIGKVRFLGLPVAKNLIFPMLFQLFSFFARKPLVFSFFHFLQDLGRPAGRMLGYDDGCLPGRKAQMLQKTKKLKKPMVFLQKNEKWKNHWKNKVFGDMRPQKTYFPMIFQLFSFFCKKTIGFFTFFIFCKVWASWQGGCTIALHKAKPICKDSALNKAIALYKARALYIGMCTLQ
jgi:hypothetical protein